MSSQELLSDLLGIPNTADGWHMLGYCAAIYLAGLPIAVFIETILNNGDRHENTGVCSILWPLIVVLTCLIAPPAFLYHLGKWAGNDFLKWRRNTE